MGPVLRKTARGVKCSECGYAVHLNRHGMVTRHQLYIGATRVDCTGVGRPPRKQDSGARA